MDLRLDYPVLKAFFAHFSSASSHLLGLAYITIYVAPADGRRVLSSVTLARSTRRKRMEG
ncbi:hypothetical protein GQ53DRAFT_528192 [Thozetella sp. PMI_491]|nr:hypothetical protein GQ53DRAFT_528192 [Thozetella sp. PMI_491]